jgi:glycerol-3-phosphate dehydrogenase
MASDNLQFDVIVIGAGVNGAGIARDAAMRGLKVLLLDKGDIGSGTSSWSTRLIHGGLRYLEHGEFRLVRESLRERACLMAIAPHLVRPIPLLVPVYEKARRGWWTIRAGMIGYDALSFNKSLPRHRMLSVAETLQQAPALNRDGLHGAAVYFDAQVEFAERLVLENVLSAVAHGATLFTYARFEKLIVEKGILRGVQFTCKDDSEVARHTAYADIVVNAAGPWVDQVLSGSNVSGPRLIGGTKGSHIIVTTFPGAPATAIYVEAETDGRPFFIIPWDGKFLIGTTDSRYQGDLDDVQIAGDEIDYLLRETNRVFPVARLTREQILYTYSGVRPLPFTGDKNAQAITRRHFIRAHPTVRGLFSIVGGKLTTYRSLAEETVDLILKQLPTHLNRGHTLEGMTAHHPLPGAVTADCGAFCANFKQHSRLPAATNDRLLRIYGTRVSLLLNLIAQDASLTRVFDSETGALSVEVVFAFRHEFATTLADCMLRRTMVGLNSSRGLTAVEAAGAIARKYLGWTERRVEQEIVAYRKEVRRFFGQGKSQVDDP